jgi:hypothetical protein
VKAGARRQQQRKRAKGSAAPDSAPRSNTRASTTPPPLPPPQDVTAIRERPRLPVVPDEDTELEDAFFGDGSWVDPDLTDLDEGRDNPELSPAQYQRRRQLRRQVAILMAVLTLFSAIALYVQLTR